MIVIAKSSGSAADEAQVRFRKRGEVAHVNVSGVTLETPSLEL